MDFFVELIHKVKCSLNSNFQKHKLYWKHHCPQIYISLKLWFLFNLWKLMHTNIDVFSLDFTTHIQKILIPPQNTVHTWSPWTWSSDWPSVGSSPRVVGVEPARRSPPWFWSASPHCCSTTRMLSCLCQLLPGDPTNRDNTKKYNYHNTCSQIIQDTGMYM